MIWPVSWKKIGYIDGIFCHVQKNKLIEKKNIKNANLR